MKKFLFIIFGTIISLNSFGLEIKGDKIVDKYGNTIDKKIYSRVIIVDPSVVEIYYMLNSESKIVGIAKTMMSKIYPEKETVKLTSVGTITKPSIEKIVINTPDLVILNFMAQGIANNLKELKIPYIINSAENTREILSNIKIYGELTGKQENATKLYSDSIKKLELLRAKLKKSPLNMKGAILYSTSPMMGFNNKSLPGEILNILGIENITDGLLGERPIISQERLILKNPDFLAGSMAINNKNDIVNSNPAVQKTTAGKNKNLLIVDSTKILRGSPRIFDAIVEFHRELSQMKNKTKGGNYEGENK